MDSNGSLQKPKNFPDPFKDKVEYINALLQQFKMFKYDNRVKIPSGYELKIDEYFENLEKWNNNYKTRTSSEQLIEFTSDRKEFLRNLIEENKTSKKDNIGFLNFEDVDKDAKSQKQNTENLPKKLIQE